ncbi:MAG: type II secretion system protein N [Legionellales bacterium]
MKLDIHYLFSAKYAQWITIGFIALFSTLIVVEFAQFIFYPITTSVSSLSDKHTETAVKQGSSQDILSASLFGIYVPNDLNDSSVKKSMLHVTLVGILLADKLDDSQVIIRSASGEEKTYKTGDSVPGGAIIKRIIPGGILVERNGILESLSFPKNNLTFEPAPKPLKEE